jgi:septal ring factor EnvC (AmiA/AmiB activator)
LELGRRLAELGARRGPLEAEMQAVSRSRAALLAEQDRELAFRRAFMASSASDHTAIYGGGVGPREAPSAGFAALRGRLPFPLQGRTEIRSARRRGADGPGLEMRAPRGTPVRAVYPGRVAFADEYADYGRTVIVEHGDGYYTVNANLEQLAVHTGDEVDAGTRLGTVGDTGSGALLYFEVRVGEATADPAEWFGI